MPFIEFPDIPPFPGVPLLPRLPDTGTIVRAVLGAAQGGIWSVLQTDRRWGIFDRSGKPLADPSNISGIANVYANSIGVSSSLSTSEVEYGKECQTSDFPVELGSFAQYNKVERPGSPAVTFAFSGSESDRAQFLNAIDLACKSVDLYDVVTPEITYIGHSIDGYRYSRTASAGATLLVVQLTLREVRQVSAQYTSSSGKTPSVIDAVPKINAGKIQPLSAVKSVITSVETKLRALF